MLTLLGLAKAGDVAFVDCWYDGPLSGIVLIDGRWCYFTAEHDLYFNRLYGVYDASDWRGDGGWYAYMHRSDVLVRPVTSRRNKMKQNEFIGWLWFHHNPHLGRSRAVKYWKKRYPEGVFDALG